jgi:hypothetical protein
MGIKKSSVEIAILRTYYLGKLLNSLMGDVKPKDFDLQVKCVFPIYAYLD